MEPISASLENYLECIYFLHEKNKFVRVADLAQSLKVKRPSVVKSLTKLKAKGLVVQEPYGHVEFTSQGKGLAEKITKKHRILKSFLTQILSVDERIAEEDACRIEHVINPQTFKNLTKFIEFMGLHGSRTGPPWPHKFKEYLTTGKTTCRRKKGKSSCPDSPKSRREVK